MKATFVLILSIIFLVFSAFFYKVYILQKDYFNGNQNSSNTDQVDKNDILKDVPSVYIEYSKEAYDKAISENRIVVLFFTSNWCQECINQDLVNRSVFEDLNTSGLVGLRSHILDSETTTELDALAKKFDVVKENTFVILDKKGAIATKYVGEIAKDNLKNKILEVGDLK